MNRPHPADRLFCVIVTHNRAKPLRACLSHTLRQDVDGVLVIDNASSDDTPSLWWSAWQPGLQ